MIRVRYVPEPPEFDATVRQPGLRALSELVGETTAGVRRGRPRKVVAARREDIKGKDFPDYWTRILPELRAAYGGVCAYLGMHVHVVTGFGTVDHFIPKTRDWSKAYEWDNYRFAAGSINRWKDTHVLPFDPFTLPNGLCALEFVFFRVVPGASATGGLEDLVVDMIEDKLHLNERICCELRRRYFDDYMSGELGLAVLERDAPFIAQELRRQGMLLPGHR